MDSVSDLDYAFLNESFVTITWKAPYTLDNLPIQGYYISYGSVNYTSRVTRTMIMDASKDRCLVTTVSISPFNDAGMGLSNNISFYFEKGNVLLF